MDRRMAPLENPGGRSEPAWLRAVPASWGCRSISNRGALEIAGPWPGFPLAALAVLG